MGMILVTASVAVFVWAVVGLIRPTWARLPSRAASVGVWGLSVVLFIIGGALMLDSTPEQTEQDDVSYSIIDSTATAGIKRSLDVRLNKRVAEDTLRALALKLKSQDSRDYDRTFITYYLPGMTVGAGAWATTHFRPDLEVKILGLWTEEEKKLSTAPAVSGEIVHPDEFSAHTKQLLALYKELHSFKDDPTFHEVGFGTCCRFHDWQTRVEALRSKAELETLADVGVLPGDLLMLGMEYMRSKGRPTEYTETMEPHYESGLTALGRLHNQQRTDRVRSDA